MRKNKKTPCIASIDASTFHKLVNLKILILSFNKLTHISPLTFKALEILEELKLDGNQLLKYLHVVTFKGLAN